MKVLYHGRTRLPPELERGAAYFADFHAMLPHCDFLSIHAPGGAATDRMIDARALSLLPDGAVLVNVARGSLIDEDALHDALTSGKLFAAGLDVFRDEPDYDMRFAALENVVLSPHVGSGSRGNPRRDGVSRVGQYCRRAGRPARHRPAMERTDMPKPVLFVTRRLPASIEALAADSSSRPG